MRRGSYAHIGNAIPFAVVLTGLWIILNFVGEPLDETWNVVFGLAIGGLGLAALLD